MRLIPVIDLLDNQAVHAVKGRREQYRPVHSVLCSTADPLAIITAFRDQLKLCEIYIADLNAIQYFDRTRHLSLIREMCRIEGTKIILDAGMSSAEDAREWIERGVHQAVIGSETLNATEDLKAIPEAAQCDRLVFSLDFKNGRILSHCKELSEMNPCEVLRQLEMAGWREVILLNLDRVGSRMGADAALLIQARRTVPHFPLLIGGGITSPEELDELNSIGVSGVLLATALHNGDVDARHIAKLRAKSRDATIIA